MHTASLPSPLLKQTETRKFPDTHALKLTHPICDLGLTAPPQLHPSLDLWT